MSRSKEELQMLQSLSLDIKIRMTQTRIRQWVHEWGEDNVYVSFSGGKDSTVLLDIVRDIYPNVEAVFVNTGLEYPEIQQFVKMFPNVTMLRPEMRFDEVIKKYGYPVIGKRQANTVELGKKNLKDKKYSLRLLTLGISPEEAQEMGLTLPDDEMLARYKKTRQGSKFNVPKYRPLLDVDFLISDKCCGVMKKAPMNDFTKKTGKLPIMATMASESMNRENMWIQYGCNMFDNKHPKSAPMSFWTEQDVLLYIKLYGEEMIERRKEGFRELGVSEEDIAKMNMTPVAPVYGDVIYEEQPYQTRIEEFGIGNAGADKLTTTGCDRTGCIFCAFGCHLEAAPSRFQRLKETHPRQYEYCMGGGEYVDGVWQPSKEGLGMKHVFDELNKIYGEGFIKY